MVAVKSGGVYFNGIKAYGELLNSANIEFNELSVFFRFYPREEVRTWKYYLAKATAASFVSGWTGWRFNCDIGKKLNFDLSESSSNYTRLQVDNIINDWYDVLAWWDGETAELWINGNLEVVKSFSGNINNDLPIAVGSQSLFYNNSKAIFSKLIIYNRALTDDEKEQIFNGVIPDGYVVYIPFTDNNGVIARDLTGNHHCRLHNCRWVKPLRYGMHFTNGGVNFASGVSVDCNYATTVAVFRIDRPAKGGSGATGRSCPLHITSDKLMIWNEPYNNYFKTTNYDGVWKPVVSSLTIEHNQVYTVAGVQNGNEEHLYVASNGIIIDHQYRTDLGDCGSYNSVNVQIGSNQFGHYNLEGDVFAAFIYNRPISEDEIKQISMNWYDENLIPRDGLVFGCILDRIKYGDVPYDFVNKVYATNIGTPRWNVGKPLRVLQA